MRTLFGLWTVFILLCACTAELPERHGLLERLNGEWNYDCRETWRLRNPGKAWNSSSRDCPDEHIGDGGYGSRVTIDTGSKTVAVGSKNDEGVKLYPYLVVEQEDDRVTLNLDGANRIFALTAEGGLIVCAAELRMDDCVVLLRAESGHDQ